MQGDDHLSPGINAFWAHPRKIQRLVTDSQTESLRRRIEAAPFGTAMMLHMLADRAVANLFHPTGPHDWAMDERTARVGQLLIMRGTWIFKRQSRGRREGVHCRIKSDRSASAPIRAECWAALEHAVGSTGATDLSGTKHAAVLGYKIANDAVVQLDPVIIGRLVEGSGDLRAPLGPQSRQVHMSQLDALDGVDQTRFPRAAELRQVEQMTEREIKNSLAVALGEGYVPNDYGGELSDLFTSRLLVDGGERSAAFVLKSQRGAPKRLTLKHLGFNGDQIERALSEPADIVVVAHNGEVHTPIRHRLEQACFYATYRERRPRWWMVLDGNDLARIFLHRNLVA